MITYLINLKRAHERLNSCEKEFKKIELEYVLVEAVDGKQIKLPHPNFSHLRYSALHGKRANLGELGCYLSHLKVLKKFIESEHSQALICEDDIEFNPAIKKIIEEALNCGIKFDLLRLSGGSNINKEKGSPFKLKKLHDKFYLSINFGFKSGTGCYLINRKGATAILKRLSTMSLPIDHAIDRDWLLNLKSLSVTPSPVSLKKELHLDNSFINATNEYKLNFFIRYWTMVPYRFFNELIRIIYKTFLYIKIKLEH